MTDPDRHFVSVAAALLDDRGRLLITQRRDVSRWEVPGGVLEAGETILSGLCREVREETGLEVEPEQLTGVYKNMALGVVALVFRCRVRGGELRLSDETRGFRWVTPEEVPGLLSDTFAVRLLDALHSPAAGPAVRAHDGQNMLPEDHVLDGKIS